MQRVSWNTLVIHAHDSCDKASSGQRNAAACAIATVWRDSSLWNPTSFWGFLRNPNLLALTSHHAPSAAFMCLSPKCEAPMHFTLVQCSHTSKLFSPLVASRCMLWINKKNLGIEHLLEDHKQKCLRCCSLTFLACMETTKPSNEWPWNIFQSKHLQALNETAQSKRHLVVHEFHVQLSSVQRHGRNLVPVYCLLGMSSGVSK